MTGQVTLFAQADPSNCRLFAATSVRIRFFWVDGKHAKVNHHDENLMTISLLSALASRISSRLGRSLRMFIIEFLNIKVTNVYITTLLRKSCHILPEKSRVQKLDNRVKPVCFHTTSISAPLFPMSAFVSFFRARTHTFTVHSSRSHRATCSDFNTMVFFSASTLSATPGHIPIFIYFEFFN